MSRNNSNDASRSDEIDLLDLFRRIGQTISGWFKALGRGFLVTIVFLLRNILPIIVSLILGAGISLLFKWVVRPVYVSDITFIATILLLGFSSNVFIFQIYNRHTAINANI